MPWSRLWSIGSGWKLRHQRSWRKSNWMVYDFGSYGGLMRILACLMSTCSTTFISSLACCVLSNLSLLLFLVCLSISLAYLSTGSAVGKIMMGSLVLTCLRIISSAGVLPVDGCDGSWTTSSSLPPYYIEQDAQSFYDLYYTMEDISNTVELIDPHLKEFRDLYATYEEGARSWGRCWLSLRTKMLTISRWPHHSSWAENHSDQPCSLYYQSSDYLLYIHFPLNIVNSTLTFVFNWCRNGCLYLTNNEIYL